MKTLAIIFTSLLMILGAQSAFAAGGHYHTDHLKSEQAVISQIKTVVPNINSGTDKQAMAVATNACGDYAKAKFSDAAASLDSAWTESNGELQKVYFAHITFDVDCNSLSMRDN